MNKIHPLFVQIPLAVLLLAIGFFAAGCEFEGLSTEEGADGTAISLSELNAQAPDPEPVPVAEPAEEAEDLAVPAPPAAPAPAPAPVVTSDNPSYSPGRVVIPAEFLKHGTMIELRFQHCSVANGMMKKVSSTVYSLPAPSDPIWTIRQIGTKAKFADGAVFDGYVRDYRSSYSMPIQKIGSTSGGAFWVRMQ